MVIAIVGAQTDTTMRCRRINCCRGGVPSRSSYIAGTAVYHVGHVGPRRRLVCDWNCRGAPTRRRPETFSAAVTTAVRTSLMYMKTNCRQTL